jgi:nicotinic acid phosphoribosyltransferase
MDGVGSLIVWWWLDKTSNDAAALVYNLKTSGTTAHRFYASYDSEKEAMEDAAQIDNMIILTDLMLQIVYTDPEVLWKMQLSHT